MIETTPRRFGRVARILGSHAARGFAACRKASVAVETALLLPMVLAFLACLNVLSEGLELLGKVTLIATTIGSIYAAQTSVNPNNATCLNSASSAIINPWPTIKSYKYLLTGQVTYVKLDSSGSTGTVVANYQVNTGVVYSMGSSFTLPNNLSGAPGATVVCTTINYVFTPVVVVPIGFLSLTLSRTIVQPTLTGNS